MNTFLKIQLCNLREKFLKEEGGPLSTCLSLWHWPFQATDKYTHSGPALHIGKTAWKFGLYIKNSRNVIYEECIALYSVRGSKEQCGSAVCSSVNELLGRTAGTRVLTFVLNTLFFSIWSFWQNSHVFNLYVDFF